MSVRRKIRIGSTRYSLQLFGGTGVGCQFVQGECRLSTDLVQRQEGQHCTGTEHDFNITGGSVFLRGKWGRLEVSCYLERELRLARRSSALVTTSCKCSALGSLPSSRSFVIRSAHSREVKAGWSQISSGGILAD